MMSKIGVWRDLGLDCEYGAQRWMRKGAKRAIARGIAPNSSPAIQLDRAVIADLLPIHDLEASVSHDDG